MGNQFLEELQEWTESLEKAINVFGIIKHDLQKEFDIPQLKADLLTLPEQIKKTQIVAFQKKAELSEVEQQMKQREAEISFEINSVKDKNGKALFPNEPTRKAELIIRSGEDEKCLALKKQRSAIEFKLWEFEAEADRLRKEFQAREAIKDLIVAELNLYTK